MQSTRDGIAASLRTESAQVCRAVARLRALHEGYAGVTEVIACGRPAIPVLEAILFAPDPSGLFEVRVRAAAALAGLGAFDVLVEFLKARHRLMDPVAQVGEEAVVGAAARHLIGTKSDEVFTVLNRLALERPIIGAIEALSSFEKPEAAPALAKALREDDCQRAASDGLLRLGASARPAIETFIAEIGDPGPVDHRAFKRAVALLRRLPAGDRKASDGVT